MDDHKYAYADPQIIMSMEEYISYMIALGGATREQAEKKARELYFEQWGCTPEEHQKEREGKDFFFSLDNKAVKWNA